MFDLQSYFSIALKISFLIAFIVLIVLLIIKYWISNTNESSGQIQKKLLNYFSKDIPEDYNSLETGSGSKNDPSLLKFESKSTLDSETSLKLSRFTIDYCRASPSLSLRTKTPLEIGWRGQKLYFDIEYQASSYEKVTQRSLLSAIPIHKSFLNLDDDLLKENLKHLLTSLNHPNLLQILHLDILNPQNLTIKIQHTKEHGSLRDLIHSSVPFENFSKKYLKSKGKPLSIPLVAQFGAQILEGLDYLHRNNWFHGHLHCGNIILDNSRKQVLLTDYDNVAFNLNIKPEIYLQHLYDYANINLGPSSGRGGSTNSQDSSSAVLVDLFKHKFNVFEKIDVLCFGNVLYEMATGRQLKAPCPDQLEYLDLDKELSEVLKLIFQPGVKSSSYSKTKSVQFEVPTTTIAEILSHRFFQSFRSEQKDNIFEYETNFNSYFSFLKEQIFNTKQFLLYKMK